MKPPIIFFAFANDKQTEGRYLRNLTRERNELKDALKKAVQNELCEILVEPDASISTILNTFQDERYRDRIAIFHYAGHADGYQLMLETRDGGHEIARGGGLVSFLGSQKGLQLIFLNGCSTQQQSEELVQKGVPLVIGTANSIPDDVATLLATRFYKGLGEGHSLGRAWKEATDEAKMREGEALYRGLDDDDAEYEPDQFPWNLYHQPGSEPVLDWNLPEAGENPLFGLDLPDDPYYLQLPKAPFRGLKRFEQHHAALFFGRGKEIRTLYDKIQSIYPIILYFGQSGVGKSSLLAAGLQPRIEDRFQVRYLRREQEKGLLGSLLTGLDSIEASLSVQNEGPDRAQRLAELERLQQELDKLAQLAPTPQIERHLQQTLRSVSSYQHQLDAIPGLLQQWREIEAREAEKPLILILDQVEEAFTKPLAGATAVEELSALMEQLREIFGQSEMRPKGKLILAFRKEYQAEIEAALEKYLLPFSKVFLSPLGADSIREAVGGIGRDAKLREHYQLTVAPELPAEIARRLSEDEGGTIAPVLQILLQKMWEAVSSKKEKVLDAKLFARFKKNMGLQDFLNEKIAHLQQLESQPDAPFYQQEVVGSGLLLDFLYQLVSPEGTAIHLGAKELQEAYQHREAIFLPLVKELKAENLLLELEGETGPVYRLTHDTLAQTIQQTFDASELPGQRTNRILQSKLEGGFGLNPTELKIVLDGQMGRHLFSPAERALITAGKDDFIAQALIRESENLVRNTLFERLRYALIAWQDYQTPTAGVILNQILQPKVLDQQIEQVLNHVTIAQDWIYLLNAEFSPDGQYLLISGYEDAQVVNLQGGQEFSFKSTVGNGKGYPACFAPDSEWLIVGISKMNRLFLFNWKIEVLSNFPPGRESGLDYDFTFPVSNPVNRKIVLTSRGGPNLFHWEGAVREIGTEVRPPEVLIGRELINVDTNETLATLPVLAFSPGGGYLLHADHRQISIIPVSDSAPATNGETQKKNIEDLNSLAFSGDGQWLITGNKEGRVAIWSWEEEKGTISENPIWEDETKNLLSDGRAAPQKTVKKKVYFEGGTGLSSACLNHDGRLMATGHDEGTILFWMKADDAPLSYQRVAQVHAHQDRIHKLLFAPHDPYVISVSRDGYAYRWDLTPILFRLLAQQLQTPRRTPVSLPGLPTELLEEMLSVRSTSRGLNAEPTLTRAEEIERAKERRQLQVIFISDRFLVQGYPNTTDRRGDHQPLSLATLWDLVDIIALSSGLVSKVPFPIKQVVESKENGLWLVDKAGDVYWASPSPRGDWEFVKKENISKVISCRELDGKNILRAVGAESVFEYDWEKEEDLKVDSLQVKPEEPSGGRRRRRPLQYGRVFEEDTLVLKQLSIERGGVWQTMQSAILNQSLRELFRWDAIPEGMYVSPQGTLLFAVGQGNNRFLFSLKKELAPIHIPVYGPVIFAQFSPDEKLLITINQKSMVQLWLTDTGKEWYHWQDSRYDKLLAARISQDGQFLWVWGRLPRDEGAQQTTQKAEMESYQLKQWLIDPGILAEKIAPIFSTTLTAAERKRLGMEEFDFVDAS